MTVYSPSSTNIDQSAPNLVKMYVIIRSWMNLIMELIGPELSKLSALELENLPYLTLHSSICKYWPIGTKLGHNISAHKILDEFDFGTNETRTPRVICLWILKNYWNWLCLHSSISKYEPISTKLGQNVCDRKISDEFEYGFNWSRPVWVICPLSDFVYTLASSNVDQWVLNMVTIYMTMRSWTSLIMGQIRQ